MSTVFRRVRRRAGKVVKSRHFYGRIRGKAVNLGVSDKQTAEITLAALIRDSVRQANGLEPSKALRDSAKRATNEHISDYIADLEALGRADGHTGHVHGRLRALVNACGWSSLQEITGDSFQAWRQRQTFSRKTVNEYLNAARAFCNWLVRNGRLGFNPLRDVVKADVRGNQAERRALSAGEVVALLKSSGPRFIYYLAAVRTGLRRAELEGLRWGDLNLDICPYFLTVRASTAKNRRQAQLPLHDELRVALLGLRPVAWEAGDLVFPVGLPRMRSMRQDFEAAGIRRVDRVGRFADFHSLRKTFNMDLQTTGAGFTTTMNLMRHNDPKLTAQTYVDKTLLHQAAAVDRLPWFGEIVGGKWTEKGTVTTVKKGSDMSATVLTSIGRQDHKTSASIGDSHDLSACVLVGTQAQLVEAGGVEPPSA